MASIRKNAAFKKVFVYILIPVVICLITLAYINYNNFKKYKTYSNSEKNRTIFKDIINAVEFQDLALRMIEVEIENNLKVINHRLIYEILPKYKEIEKVDLNKMRVILGLDTLNEDIYIINKSGEIVNTTFKKDKNLNLFDFGERHKNLIKILFKHNEFISERFAIEASTKRLRKYSYQPTTDKNYLVEFGIYSNAADKTVDFIKKMLAEVSRTDSRIKAVDIFISADKPFSLNKETRLDTAHYKFIHKAIKTKSNQIFEEEVDGKTVNYEYVYIPRKNTVLYKDAVIRIISDKSDEAQVYFYLVLSLIVFCAVLILSVVIFYIKLQLHQENINRYH